MPVSYAEVAQIFFSNSKDIARIIVMLIFVNAYYTGILYLEIAIVYMYSKDAMW